MINRITKENFDVVLVEWMMKNSLNQIQVAKVVGCSKYTIQRLLQNESFPTSEMIKQAGLIIEIGYKRYSKLSKCEKEKFSETIGTVSGSGLGFASITAVVSTLGTAGLSGAGIMSGLAAAGYGLIKGIKGMIRNYRANDLQFNTKWEMNSWEVFF